MGERFNGRIKRAAMGITSFATRLNPTYSSSAANARGVTLVELCTSISIIGILASVAIPGFAQLQRTNGRATAVNGFIHTLALARSEAIKRSVVVSVCRSVEGTRCDNRTAQWNSGWIVFINRDHDQPADLDEGEEILHRNDGWRDGIVTSNRLSFSYRPTYQADVNGTVLFCHPRGGDAEARAVIISHTGRARVSKRDASNRPLRCAL